jgi:cAMP-dependent protein kinase regulator
MERPESNLSFYKARAGAESRASASTRACDSRSSNRFADTPTDDPDNDDIDYYDHQFAKKMQNARAIEPCRDRGHFRDFKLPERSIDDCSDTHYSIRHSSCLRERLEARRYQAFHGLGNCASGLKNLDKVLLAAEEDELNAMERPESPRKVVGGFSMQIARTRQGLRGQFISKVPILSLDILTEEEQFWVVGKLRPKNYEKHSKIFIQGEAGHELFIIESGTCIVTKEVYGDIMRICEMKPGEFFGEMAVIYDIPRTATITAATTVKLLALSRKDIATVVSAASLEKMKSMTRMQLLLAIPGLTKLTFEQRAKFVGALRDESYPAGTEIMREGYRTGQTAEFGSNRRLLLLEDGVCSESRTNNYANMCDSRLLSGNYFGLVELFYGGPHQSTVVAQTDVKLLSISWEDLQSFLTAEAVSVFETMQRSLRILLLRQAHPLLHDKNDQTLTTVLAQGTFRRFAPWHVILRKGEPISCLMMLEEGTCVEHDGDLGTLMEDYGQDRERGNQEATNQYEDRSSDGVKSREHTQPGDSLESIDAIVAPWTLVATTTCSVLFVPIQVLRRLRQQSGSLRQQSGSLGSSKEFQ